MYTGGNCHQTLGGQTRQDTAAQKDGESWECIFHKFPISKRTTVVWLAQCGTHWAQDEWVQKWMNRIWFVWRMTRWWPWKEGKYQILLMLAMWLNSTSPAFESRRQHGAHTAVCTTGESILSGERKAETPGQAFTPPCLHLSSINDRLPFPRLTAAGAHALWRVKYQVTGNRSYLSCSFTPKTAPLKHFSYCGWPSVTRISNKVSNFRLPWTLMSCKEHLDE